jgi:hypothetical protein
MMLVILEVVSEVNMRPRTNVGVAANGLQWFADRVIL